ncbi:MAG: SDR family NAD(P)-dependent oxidoreductase [Agarilytica sp.]
MVNGKSILITGCSSGIGKSAAFTLQSRGYQVIASVRKPEDIVTLLEEGIEHVIHLDLQSTESIESAITETLKITGGQLYALFNNGAYGQPGAVEDLTRETLLKQFQTNVFGTHELTVKILPYLTKDDSRIIQNSSILGFVSMPMRGAYNASKHALEGLTDTLRIELSETNTKISIIQPGPIKTDFRKNALIALEDNVDITKSRHQSRYEGALTRLKKVGAASRFTLGPESVVNKVIHALESERPKVRYKVTFPTYFLALIKPIFPARVFDKVLMASAKSEG